MRTTLTLDADVAALVKRALGRGDRPLEKVINDALRKGLSELEHAGEPTPRYSLEPMNLGGSIIGSLDSVEDVLARAEGEWHK